MTRRRIAFALITLGVLPFVVMIAGLAIATASGCLGQGATCTLYQTDLGRITVAMILAGWWLIVSAPVGVIGVILLVVDAVKKG